MAVLSDDSSQGSGVATLDRSLGQATDSFAEAGAVGVIVVDASAIEEVERCYGGAVHQQVIQRLLDRVADIVASELRADDLVLCSEMGRNEVVVLFFRDRHDGQFYSRDLPRLTGELDEALASLSSRISYPYTSEAQCYPAGLSRAIYDATLRADTQLHRARNLALEDAQLRGRLADAQRRERFLSLLFSERLRSVYEPITRLTTQKVLGYEALVRGEAGTDLASPADLFGAAARCDSLFELDCLCRRIALQDARRLPEGTKLFLNCLPSAIHDPAFQPDSLGHLLEEHDIAPSDLVFEISEKESIGNFAIFREVCDHYRSLGVKIALDDVGAGYSSLQAVTELSPDFLKVDMALVRGIHEDPSRQEILKALASTSWRIDASIIAEGIERQEELDTLNELAIPYGQGYLLGRAAEFKPEEE